MPIGDKIDVRPIGDGAGGSKQIDLAIEVFKL
jgi:hypothetical protein